MDLPGGDYNQNDVGIFLTMLSVKDREFIVDFYKISRKANLPANTLFKGFDPTDLSQHADVRAPFYKKYKNTKYLDGIKLFDEMLSKIRTIRRKNQFIADVCQLCFDNRPTDEPVAETKSQSFPEGFPEGCPQRGQKWFSNLCWFDATVFATLIDPSGFVSSQVFNFNEEDADETDFKISNYLLNMYYFIFNEGDRPTEDETKACFKEHIGDFDSVERALKKIGQVVNGNINVRNNQLRTKEQVENNTILSSQLDNFVSAKWLVIQDDDEETMQAFGQQRKPLSDIVPQGMEAYAWVMPTSKGGSHFNCIYKCGNDYYLYDDIESQYGENRIKQIDAQQLINRRNGKTCWIFCHKSEEEAYGETKTNKKRRVENSSLSEEIEKLQKHFEDIGIGVRYSLDRGVLPGTSTENTIPIPAAKIEIKVIVWNWVNKGIDVQDEINELVESSFDEGENLSPEEKEKIVVKGYMQAHKHLIDVIEFCGRENVPLPTLPTLNIRFEIDKVKMNALRRKGGREGGFHGDGNYLYDILGDFVGNASEFKPTDVKSVYQRFEHPYTAEYLEYKTGRSMSDAASILAKIKAKLHHVDETGNAWTDRGITKTYTKTFHGIIAQELEQISKPSFGFLDTAEQHDALRIYEDIYSVNTSLANKMVREFQERVN